MKKLTQMKKASYEIREYAIVKKVAQTIRILFISDLHFKKKSHRLALAILQDIEDIQPDIILLGGDYSDTKKGNEVLSFFLSQLVGKAHIYCIAGNHDRWRVNRRVQSIFSKHDLDWLSNTSCKDMIKGTKVSIHTQAAACQEEDLNILLLHEPITYTDELSCYDVIVAGHLHGGQIVLFEKEGNLYPLRYFYKNGFLEKKINKTLYIISKGMGDLIPFRINCKRDMVLVDIE